MSQAPFFAHGPRSEGTRSASEHAHPGRQATDWNQQDVGWDQEAALDALVAAVEAGRVDVPPAEADDDLSLGRDHARFSLRRIPIAAGTESALTTGRPSSRRQGGRRYADVPLSEMIAEADARDTYDVAEVCAAGFLPRSVPARQVSSGPAGGFASGGALDTAEPGPVLAAFADEVTGPDGRCAGASDDELIGVLRAWQRQEAWSAARKLAVIAELIRRRPEPACEPPPSEAQEARPSQVVPGAMPLAWEKFCGDELAAALTCSGRAAEKLLSLAYDLAARLPGTARALHDGIIDAYKARIIADSSRTLDQPGAAAAEALILPSVADKTPGQLRAVVGRAVLTVDPDAGRERRERAERDARVELWREEAGTAALCGRDLPPAEALAADQRITAYARDLKAAGLGGTMDQLRARAFLDLALGTSSLPRPPAPPGSAPPGSAPPGSAPPGSASPGYASPAHRTSPAPGTAVPPHAPGTSETEAAGQPGRDPIDGTQPGPGLGPAAARPAAACPADAGSQESEHSITEPSEPGLGHAVGPGGLAARINLTVPLATLLGLAGRPGEAAGFGGVDPELARALAESAARNPRTTWCVTVTDQDGHPTSHGCARRTRLGSRRPGPDSRRPGPDSRRPAAVRPKPPADPQTPAGRTARQRSLAFTPERDHGPPGGNGRWRLRVPGTPGQELIVDLGPLAVVDCDHRDQSAGYEPSDRLRHLVEVRDGECTWLLADVPRAAATLSTPSPMNRAALPAPATRGPAAGTIIRPSRLLAGSWLSTCRDITPGSRRPGGNTPPAPLSTPSDQLPSDRHSIWAGARAPY